MTKRFFISLVALLLATLACGDEALPTAQPTVTSGPKPTAQPTPDNLDLESIIVKSDDLRFEGVEWVEVTAEYITINAPGGRIKMHQLVTDPRKSVIWTLYTNDAEPKFVSNYGVENVQGTETDIRVGRGDGWAWSIVQLQIDDNQEVVVMHLIGRSWAMAFRRHELNKWEASLIPNWVP